MTEQEALEIMEREFPLNYAQMINAHLSMGDFAAKVLFELSEKGEWLVTVDGKTVDLTKGSKGRIKAGNQDLSDIPPRRVRLYQRNRSREVSLFSVPF